MRRLLGSRRRILVTGGAGFLGVNNFFTGTKWNIGYLRDHLRFEFLRHDVCQPLKVEVDEIHDLACPASFRRITDPAAAAQRPRLMAATGERG